MTLGPIAVCQSSRVICSRMESCSTMAPCTIPRIGGSCSSSSQVRKARARSSLLETSQLIATTRQPASRNQAMKGPVFCVLPALRERRIRFRAPWSTIQCAIERPIPPTPPTSRYDASDFKFVLGTRGRTFTSSPGGIESTIFPVCLPVCTRRKALETSCIGYTCTG